MTWTTPGSGLKTEREGFEPSRSLTTPNGFRDRRIRPLCHLSGRDRVPAAAAQRDLSDPGRRHGTCVVSPLSSVGRSSRRMGVVPVRVAPCEGRSRRSVREDRERDRDDHGRDEDVLVRQPPSSTRITAKTIDARPRGPNQPRKPTVGRLAPGAEHGDADRDEPDEREAEGGVEHDRDGRRAERRLEHDGTEDEEGHGVEQASELLDEVTDLAAAAAFAALRRRHHRRTRR